MIHVPVQLARPRQWVHLIKLNTQRTIREAEGLRVTHQLPKISALERNRETLTKLGEVNAQAVRTRQYRDAGEPAFGDFGLEEGRIAISC